MLTNSCRIACEKRRNLAIATVMAGLLLLPARPSSAAQEHAAPSPTEHAAAQGPGATPDTHSTETAHASEGAHGNPLSGLLWPVANFAVLVAVLRRYLRAPAAEYFASRKAQIRKDLIDAATLKSEANAQLAEIDARLKALPAELDALRTRGRQETEAEQQRIAKSAAAERARLVEQTRRDIDLQVRNARRELTEHAARLALQLAETRITREISAVDHDRLSRQYVDQVGARQGLPS